MLSQSVEFLDALDGDAEEGDADEDDPKNLFSAAYDEVTYRDSTGDGREADMLEGRGPSADFELDFEAARLGPRLAFLATVARLWKLAAAFPRQLAGACRDEQHGAAARHQHLRE